MKFRIVTRDLKGLAVDVTETSDKAHARTVFFERIAEYRDTAAMVTLHDTSDAFALAVMECSAIQIS